MIKFFDRFIIRVLSSLSFRYWGVFYRDFRSRYAVSPGFRFNGRGILLYGDGEIYLGDNSYISDNSMIQSVAGFSVRIGSECQVSSNVRIFTSSAVADSDFYIKPVPVKCGNVVIGDACWIGANVLISPGVSIGENSVVGANSVVVRDVPAGEIWGGVPARFIRRKSALSCC